MLANGPALHFGVWFLHLSSSGGLPVPVGASLDYGVVNQKLKKSPGG